ncbi:MAG: hypothetical protein U0900_22360 [Myxococcota bacterium]
MLTGTSAWAGQADLSLETRLGGDSNVFRQEKRDHPKLTSDGTFDLSPRVGFRDENDDLPYSFDYQPTYRKFMTTSGITGVDHIAHGKVGWRMTPLDSLEASGSYFNGRQFLFGTQGTGSTFSSVNDRERIRISDGNLGYRRSLTPQLSLRVQGILNDFDASGTSPNSQTDSRVYTGRVALDYDLDALTELGLSTSGRYRQNRAVGIFRPSSTTEVWDVMASVSRKLSPTWSVSVQAGPSIIRQQQIPGGGRDPSSASCVPGSFSTTCDRYAKDEKSKVTAFAAASIKKQWKVSDLTVSYVRSESRSGTVNSSSAINDEIDVDGSYRINDRIVLRASGAWSRYSQVAKQQALANKFKIDAYRASGVAEFIVSRRIMLLGQYTYAHQDNSNSLGGSSSVGVHTGYVAIRYSFESLSY